MEKNRGTAIAVIVALVVSVISLGVAFATFSTTLNINGSATVQATSWNVFFASASDGSKPGSAAALPVANISTSSTASSVSADLSADTFTWEATLKTLGDYVIYTFYARNTGSYNAKVRSTLAPTITCKDSDNANKDTWCQSHVTYGIYKNAECTQAVSQNDPLTVSTGYAQYWVKVALTTNFQEDGSDLPTKAITVTGSPVSVYYDQDGSAQ